MDHQRFDHFTRAMASGMPRRGLLKAAAAGLAGLVAGSIGRDEALADPGTGGSGGKGKGRCPEGFVNCRGDCVILAEDPNNCGGCSVVCPPTRICQNGQCVAVPVACSTGERECNGGCIPEATCCPEETRPCYTGPAETEGVGVCRAGVETCTENFVFGACVDEVTPQPVQCNGLDNDCDGQIDDTGEILTCGTGACLRSVPACIDGVPQTCVPGTPQPETCNGVDDDCNGLIDDDIICPDGDRGEICDSIAGRCCFPSGTFTPSLGIDCERCCSGSCDFFGSCR
jgi:hypothetical protein